MTYEAQRQDREASSLHAWKKQGLRPVAEVVGWVLTVPGSLVERVTCEKPGGTLSEMSLGLPGRPPSPGRRSAPASLSSPQPPGECPSSRRKLSWILLLAIEGP